jgi:hypothetical protein
MSAKREQEEARNRAISVARELDQGRAEFLEDEFETYELLREHLPIARTGGTMQGPVAGGAWFLTRYEDMAEVLREPADFSSQISNYPVRPWIPQAVDPPMHTSYRRILNPWFTVDAMSKLEPHLEQFADELIGAMVAQDEFDFVADFADPFPTKIFCELMGFPPEDHPQIMDWKNCLMHGNDGHPRGGELARARAEQMGLEVGEEGEIPSEVRMNVGVEIYGYLAEQIEAHRKDPRDDLISKLLEARYEGERPLTEEELQDTRLGTRAGREALRGASRRATPVRGAARRPTRGRRGLRRARALPRDRDAAAPRDSRPRLPGRPVPRGRHGLVRDALREPRPRDVREPGRADLRPQPQPAHGLRAGAAPLSRHPSGPPRAADRPDGPASGPAGLPAAPRSACHLVRRDEGRQLGVAGEGLKIRPKCLFSKRNITSWGRPAALAAPLWAA